MRRRGFPPKKLSESRKSRDSKEIPRPNASLLPERGRVRLSAHEAAKSLGIRVTTLYDWLGQSDHGLLIIRGEPTTIRYFQGGRNGQGRIQIDSDEVDRILELMRVVPQRTAVRQPIRQQSFPGITVKLGIPEA